MLWVLDGEGPGRKWAWTKNPREEFPQGGEDPDLDALADHASPAPLRTVEIDDRDGRTGRVWLVTAADVSPRDAARGRLDLLRLAGTGGTGDGLGEGRYTPPRGCGPVGDMLAEEWFESLPEGLPWWPKVLSPIQ